MTTDRWRAENLPVNLITGMLGAGKTTLIRQLLGHAADERWAVLVNEFGEVGLDGDWLAASGAQVREVAGGCMGCTAAVALRVTLNRLIRETRPTRLLIEPSGLGHPAELLRLLRDPVYQGVLDLGATLCLIDPRRLGDARFAQSPLWLQQLACADVLVGTRADLWDAAAEQHWQALCAQHPQLPAVRSAHRGLDAAWLAAPRRPAASAPVFTLSAPLTRWDACGWQLPSGWQVTETALRRWLASFSWERIKGELAAVGCAGWRLDAVAGEITLLPLEYRPASRIQVIVSGTCDWPARQQALLACGGGGR